MTRVDPLAALDAFELEPAKDKRPRSDRADVEKMAKENGFVSRDPKKQEPQPMDSLPAVKRRRRYTTGRNQQINIKATADTIARFNAKAEALGIPAGALLEKALAALEDAER